jgi:hypothetical protein
MKFISIQFSILRFLIKNLFLYSISSFIGNSFDPRNWLIYQHFWGGVLFSIIEFYIINTSFIVIEEEKNGN